MSLRLRLLAAFAYVLVLVLAAIEVPFALSVRSRVDAEVRAQALNEAHLIAASASGSIDRPEELARVARRAARDLAGRVIIVNGRGRLLADSAGSAAPNSSYRDRTEIAAVLASGRAVQGERHSDTLDQDLLYTAVPVTEEGARVGVVRVTQSVEPIDSRVRRDVLALAAIGLAALGFGLVLAWVLAGSLSRPLRALAAVARRLGSGDLDARAEPTGAREQREVATAFNAMAERLGRVLEGQREFVANASHQLRTPLTGLRLRLEAAALRADDPELERELAAAEREVERLSKLLAGLLTLAREGGDAPAPRPVDLAAASADAADRWLGQAAQGGQSIHLSGSGDAWALASEEDVATMLDALVENALRYSPPGTTVFLTWQAGRDSATVAVLDEGPGIAAGEEEAVFERFRRGSASVDADAGTGLGLAIVRALAARWDGSASITNGADGARAEIRLPSAPVPTRVPPPEVAAR